ncbi:MAG: 2Fe-2S iron-sulfur cluster-binding protein [Bacillota bacterium]|nr:2Fe-2S iron-sulfur cluster-binding protein [Bacillota bacterium]MDW7684943.1 2Fe-2S iron-sulfur cluster-binding protein [Bacillota bacterium]
MTKKTLTVLHFNPAQKTMEPREYQVPSPPGATVLQALQYIYEELDPTLAFRYGCRFDRCGLCGVMADGKPRLACKTKLATTAQVAPLAGLPLLRGLAVDRVAYMEPLSNLNLYPQGRDTEPLGQLHEDPLHKNLMHCLECLCCVASCPEYKDHEASFGGPFPFVKLAQLHLDPRDETDRRAQAKSMGLDKCSECVKCTCPNGIHLHKAISALQCK